MINNFDKSAYIGIIIKKLLNNNIYLFAMLFIIYKSGAWMEYGLIVASMLVAATLGANDIANAIGTTVGVNIVPYKKAVVCAAVALVIGAFLGGNKISSTIGKGIIDTSALSFDVLAISLFCAALAVAVATYLRFPVSTTQSVVGALAGTGLAAGLTVDSSVVVNIAVIWTILPVFSAVLSFAMFFIFFKLFRLIFKGPSYLFEKTIAVLVFISGMFVAFSLGTNNIGNVVGVLAVNNVMDTTYAILLGSLSIALGALFFSKRVIFTIGKGITTLDPIQAFSSQLSASVAVIICTMLGVPVSLSQATVGSVVGVGLTRGKSSVNKRFILRIIGSWIATPLCSGVATYLLYFVI